MNDIEELMKEARDDGNESALSDDDADKKERMQSMLLPPQTIISPNYTLPFVQRHLKSSFVLKWGMVPQLHNSQKRNRSRNRKHGNSNTSS